MNKVIKTILIISIAVFGVGTLFVPPTSAQAQNLVVEFEQTPLFNETNFLPGGSVTRWVKVTNNSNSSKLIATQAINVSDLNRLGDVLILEIKESGVTRYINDLSRFFAAGEVTLSRLTGNGTSTQYDFIVSFYSGAGNPFQEENLGFDILVGFQGEEGGLPPGARTGAGGFLPPGLTIPSESVKATEIGETSVTITWLTSYSSTSQVIYAVAGETYSFDLTKPNYGYPHAAPVPEDSTKVTFHSVTIIGLTPGTTYYFRCVSHASLAISQEYTFTTKGVKGWAIGEEEIGIPEIIRGIPEGVVPPEEEMVTVPPEERVPGEGLGPLLLASLGVIRETAWMAIVVTICLLGLVIIGIREWELARKKKKSRL